MNTTEQAMNKAKQEVLEDQLYELAMQLSPSANEIGVYMRREDVIKFATKLMDQTAALTAASAEAATPIGYAAMADTDCFVYVNQDKQIVQNWIDEYSSIEGINYFLAPLYTDAPQASQPIGQPEQAKCGGREYCSRMPFCGCGQPPLFPERDPSKPAEQQGIFRKFDVRRVDGSDAPGGKHHGCRYFVIDMDHDLHAPAALRAYADSCAATHPQLAADLRAEFGASNSQPVSGAMTDEDARNKVAKALGLEAAGCTVQGKRVSFGWEYLLGLIEDCVKACESSASGQAVRAKAVRDAALEEAARVCLDIIEQYRGSKHGKCAESVGDNCASATNSAELNPVEPGALTKSIAELEKWYGDENATEDLPTSLLESIGLVLHELKRLQQFAGRAAAQGEQSKDSHICHNCLNTGIEKGVYENRPCEFCKPSLTSSAEQVSEREKIDFADARRFLDSWGCMVHPIPQIIDMAERAALSAPERKVISDDEIERIALENGFVKKQLPDGDFALKPYVFEFARALLNQQGEQTAPEGCKR